MPGGANLGVPALRVPQLFDRQAHKRSPSILFDGGTRYDKLTTRRQRGWALLARNAHLLRNLAIACVLFVRPGCVLHRPRADLESGGDRS